MNSNELNQLIWQVKLEINNEIMNKNELWWKNEKMNHEYVL